MERLKDIIRNSLIETVQEATWTSKLDEYSGGVLMAINDLESALDRFVGAHKKEKDKELARQFGKEVKAVVKQMISKSEKSLQQIK